MSKPDHDWKHAGYYGGRDEWTCRLCKVDWLDGEPEPPVCHRVTAAQITPHATEPRNTRTTTSV